MAKRKTKQQKADEIRALVEEFDGDGFDSEPMDFSQVLVEANPLNSDVWYHIFEQLPESCEQPLPHPPEGFFKEVTEFDNVWTKDSYHGCTIVSGADVIVAIDSTHAVMVPGLTAVCRIVIEEIPDALVVPLECVFDQDSLKVVYTRDGGAFIRHEVTVAQQGNNFAIIADGIGEGDILTLRKPGDTLITD